MTAPTSPDAITAEHAAAIFAEFLTAGDLALRFPADGCYARAHIMLRRLRERGILPMKIWAFAAGVADPLWIDTPNHTEGRVRWGYHVAPIINIGGPGGEISEMVLDPILFDRPVTIGDWRSALHDTPTIVRTSFGEPPLPARGGSGYWPAPDPIEGPDVHACETLEDYQRLTS